LTAELPGVDPADIDISVKDDVVTISGERKPPETDDATVWHRRERAYGRFSRVVQLPYRVDPERIEARMGDGVLQIELHRPEADKPRRIRINAN
jgi:HSP20 family protein